MAEVAGAAAVLVRNAALRLWQLGALVLVALVAWTLAMVVGHTAAGNLLAVVMMTV